MSTTSDTSVSGSGSSPVGYRGRRTNTFKKTKFERDIEAAVNRGVSSCNNVMHWHTTVVPGGSDANPWTDVRTKPDRTILEMMAPGPARCLCERRACQWAWNGNWNHKGMYTTQWVLEGHEQKGIPHGTDKEKGPVRHSAKRVWPMYHSVDEKVMKQLIHRFPEKHFVSMDSASHDHPLAHYSTKIASERLMSKLPVGTVENPKVYIDLNGNPGANAAFMRRTPGVVIITLVECITPKDFVNRAIKWGPQYDASGDKLWYDDVHVRDIPRDLSDMGSCISGFISMHTTYYYQASEISALLDWAPGAVYYASMHKFDGMSGNINAGEQHWEKTPSSFGPVVRQSNSKTQEAYEHPDNSWWYEYDSRICGDTAFGWTMGELCEETYFFLATAVPVKQARMSSKSYENRAEPRPTSTGTAQSKASMYSTCKVVVSLYGAKVEAPIKPAHVDLFDKMRTTLIGKPRGAKEYKDHVSRCKVAKGSVMSDTGVDIEAQQLADLARLSFMIDFEDNYKFDSAMFGNGYTTQIMADHLYKNGTGCVHMGTVSVLSDMLMDAVDSKNLKVAGIKALRTGLTTMQRRGVLNSVK